MFDNLREFIEVLGFVIVYSVCLLLISLPFFMMVVALAYVMMYIT